jgi:hypothetical protein
MESENYIVFNKLYDAKEKGEIEIQIQEGGNLSEVITVMNKYRDWLNSDECKNELINKFCEFVNSYSDKPLTVEEVINNNWYDSLEINSVLVRSPVDSGKLTFFIGVVDKWHILYVDIRENKIISVDDEYVDPESGIGYDGVW